MNNLHFEGPHETFCIFSVSIINQWSRPSRVVHTILSTAYWKLCISKAIFGPVTINVTTFSIHRHCVHICVWKSNSIGWTRGWQAGWGRGLHPDRNSPVPETLIAASCALLAPSAGWISRYRTGGIPKLHHPCMAQKWGPCLQSSDCI